MTADPSHISMTAKLAAYYRQFTDIPFAAEAADRVGAADAFEALVRDHGLKREQLTFYAPMFEARYKSITELIRKSGATQVLELASGYSLRGLDLTRHAGIRYVETDLAAVVETKRALLDDLRVRHGIAASPHHVLTAADALDLDALRAAAAVLDPAQPVVVLCEGLILYLTQAETERLATNVHALLDDFGGTWMTPDFVVKAESPELPPERARLREAITGITQRQLDASSFDDAAALAAFLRRVGFEAVVRRQVDETPAFSSLGRLGLSAELLERLRPALRVWVMSPL
ncbi:MAG TPA: class I SAM-dependent methyltransferase [Polyangiaceae bacterium]|nr:class I SAM-dependent methyltransferase [Polyangiaceae bacterium]